MKHRTRSNNTSTSKKSNLSSCHRATTDKTNGARHPNLQSAFHCNPSRHRRQVSPLPLMPSPRTNRTHPKSPPPIKGSAKNIRIRACSWPPQLHKEAICPSWLRNRSPHQTGQLQNLGHEIGCRLQPWHVDGTPPLFSSVCCKNQSNKDK